MCSLIVNEKQINLFEQYISNLGKEFGLAQRINLKKIRRAKYDYSPFERLSYKKKKEFWEKICSSLDIFGFKIVASVIDKKSHNEKYSHPDPALKLSYKFLLEKIDQFLIEKNENGIVIYDENMKKEELRKCHYFWENFGTGWQKIEKIYWAPFFIREEESHLMQMADIGSFSLHRLFNQKKCDYFEKIKDSFYWYGTKSGRKIAIKVFPDAGEKISLYECKDFEICYWNFR